MVDFTTSTKLPGGYMPMKSTAINLQDLFLNNARKERIPVTIYLMNGVKVNGQVKGFDSYIILLEDEKRQQNMIYKHAVSTILPAKYINMQNNNNNQQNTGFNK